MLVTALRRRGPITLVASLALAVPIAGQIRAPAAVQPRAPTSGPPPCPPPAECPVDASGCTGALSTTVETDQWPTGPNTDDQCMDQLGLSVFDWCSGSTVDCDGAIVNCAPQDYRIADPLSLAKFTAAPCQRLLKAELHVELTTRGSVRIENLSAGTDIVSWDLNAVVCVQLPTELGAVLPVPIVLMGLEPLTGYDGMTDYRGSSGTTKSLDQVACADLCITDADVLETLTYRGIGLTTFTLGHLGEATSTHQSSGNVDFLARICGRVQATITYTYCCCTTAPPVHANACAGGPAIDVCLPLASCPTCTASCDHVTFGPTSLGGSLVPSPDCAVLCEGPGCCVRYTPPAMAAGTDTFTYTVSVPGCPPATGVVTVDVCKPVTPNVMVSTCSTDPIDICLPIGAMGECGTLACATIGFSAPVGGGTVAPSTACTSCAPPSCCVRYDPAGSTGDVVTFDYTVTSPLVPGCSSTGTVTVSICRLTAPDVTANVCADGTVDICLPLTATAACGPITCSNVSFSSVSCGAVTPSPACTVPCAGPGCCVRFDATGCTGDRATFDYTVTAPGVPDCTATGTVTVDICRITAPTVCIEVCPGSSMTACLPFDATTACGTVTCANVMLGTVPAALGELHFTACPLVPSCGADCCIEFTAADGIAATEIAVPYTIVDDSPSVSCSRDGEILIRVHPTPDAVEDRACFLLPLQPVLEINVLANDSPGASCTFGASALSIVTPCMHGTVVVDDSVTPPRIRYTPDATLPTDMPGVPVDSFRYRVCNACPGRCPNAASSSCCDEALVEICVDPPCPVDNRLECGSLLIFPEYDHRAAQRTLVTITDGCCLDSQSTTSVQVVFIDKSDCSSTNVPVTLTPCDTVTFVTSFLRPGGTQGFLYAYARDNVPTAVNPTGSPIVFDHLVGQEVVISGLTTFDYALNAIALKGWGEEGELNDDDGDGIRDLNAILERGAAQPTSSLAEYSVVPDRILVPRFLGQSTDVQSRLVLLGLSGGRLFQTQVAIQGFNDDEVSFSASHLFRCWDDPPLATISAAFLQTSMIAAGDDPDEIHGMSSRESGWFHVDGDVAFSTQETIHDPAIYAVLVERSGARAAADLPFELCGQANGDLFPIHIFGDGPGAHDGDDQ